DLVSVQREATYGACQAAPRAFRQLAAVLPDQFARRGVKRLYHVERVGEEHDPVVDQGGRLVDAGFHRPDPCQLQIIDVLGGDLVQRAVTPGVQGTTPVDPVARIGV